MIEYKGKEYPARTFTMTSDETGEITRTIADSTLSDALHEDEEALEDDDTEEGQIDMQIYFYVEAGELELPAAEICKNLLDMEFKFIEE